ncbi:MAG TPA: M20/M25/M40 family metallo-hydrolase [Planctomycetota bacterium]|nr:M20/M25/M40 family metallo-hydrolase [Planctomycetota bacterium]HRR81634.1 M20/M25/M40 family metallo-hydrolase [Planctomycetota bacterium]HRT96638.1 M20/M25/M40 family metallo-hydrolase [Planctomycetota bacterium]
MSSADSRRELDVRLVGEAMVSDDGLTLLRELCETYGSRFAASGDERRAGDFLLERMRAVGLSRVHAEPFRLLAWRRGRKPTLEVVSPARERLDCIALPYSPATRGRGIELELVSVGEGMPEDFARLRGAIRGKAVLATSESPGYYHRWVHRAEKYTRACAAGAKAFLFMNHYDGLLAPTGTLRFDRKPDVPGLGVSKETGLCLMRLLGQGTVRLRIQTHDAMFQGTSRNIIGEFPGNEHPEQTIVVGGHYDGHDISQAAHDNGSGVATVLEAARLLAPHRARLRRTVRFVCFGAEEVGLRGGHAYVERHRSEMARTRLMVNVDCIGSERGKGFDFQCWSEAKAPLAAMASEMRQEIVFAARPNPYSDHFPFMVAGVPVCMLGNVGGAPKGRGYGHTAADTLDKVSRADLREAAALLARSLVRFANDRAWALRHRNPAEIRRALDRYELIDVMKTEGTLPKELR